LTDGELGASRARAIAGSIGFLVVAPGVMAGVIPWLITGWDANGWWLPLRMMGVAIAAGGVAVLIDSFARFALEGLGTPAPPAPTDRLIVTGPYRFVRNPMYVAVTSLIVGQGLLFGSPALFAYAAAFAGITAAFVHAYEEPTLLRAYGAEYETYRGQVPGWWPRLTAWSPTDRDER
jgi:protein-S-isoprenylcysteine O-methyltransferase Ste14